jgi:phenylpyruvate tautomerase PptA (4-oxalocrotonate tautomerase family)
MPHAKVHATAGRTSEQKRALLEAIHQALVDGLGIPDWDRQVRLLELADDEVILPEQHDKASYVLVEVFGFPRSIEVKRDLYAALAKHLAGVGIAPTDTKVNYYDLPPDAWGIDGEPASDVMERGSTDWSAKY